MICELCKKKFNKTSNYNRHINKCHQTFTNCIMCGEQFHYCDITEHHNNCYHRTSFLLSKISYLENQILQLQKSNVTNQTKEINNSLGDVSAGNDVNNTIDSHDTTNINIIIQNLQPITTEYLKECSEKLTIEHIIRGSIGYAEFIVDIMKDKWVKDKDRMVYKNEEGRVIRDKNFTILRDVCKQIKDRNANEIDKETDRRYAIFDNIVKNAKNSMDEDESTDFGLLMEEVLSSVTSLLQHNSGIKNIAENKPNKLKGKITRDINHILK